MCLFTNHLKSNQKQTHPSTSCNLEIAQQQQQRWVKWDLQSFTMASTVIESSSTIGCEPNMDGFYMQSLSTHTWESYCNMYIHKLSHIVVLKKAEKKSTWQTYEPDISFECEKFLKSHWVYTQELWLKFSKLSFHVTA